MDKMTFREAQLLVIGAEAIRGRNPEFVVLNNLQTFRIGDCAEVTEIRLDRPVINVCVAEGTNSYCDINNFSDGVVEECIEILREVAYNVDEYNEHV